MREPQRSQRSSRILSAALLALLLTPGIPVAAQSPDLDGQPIISIRLLVDGREVRDDSVLRVLETKVGLPFSRAGVRESIVHLVALRRFEDVQVAADREAGGVALTYTMTPLQEITNIEFEGDLGLGENRLRSVIDERFTGIPPSTRAAEVSSSLEALLHERGFRAARVLPRVRLEKAGSRATLVFEVAAGARVRVASLNVTGAPVGDAAGIASRLRLGVGEPFDRDAVLDRVDQYTEALRRRGYYEARVDLEATYSEDGLGAAVTVNIVPGPHVTLVFRGDAIPEDKRNEVLPLDRGDVLDEDRLEDASLEIERYLRGLGYREATAPFTREQRGPGEVLLVFTVKRGPQHKIAGVDIVGAQQVPQPELSSMLSLEPGQWFVQSRLDADTARLTEEYRRRGFRDATITSSAQLEPTADALLRVRLNVAEGPRTTVGDLLFEGNTSVPTAVIRALVGSLPGRPFYQPQVNADRDAVLSEYLTRGHQLATVQASASLSPDKTTANLRFQISEGPRIVVDRVLVVGNERNSALDIERETRLLSGMPISPQSLAEAQRRLTALGLFRRVQVTELQHGSETRRDILVLVEEGPVNRVGYGGGLEGARRLKRDAATGRAVEEFDLAPRGFFEVGRRNLWGKNRSVNLFVRAAIRSSDQVNSDGQPSDPDPGALEDTGSGFREYRVLGTFREPNFLGLPVDLAITGLLDQAIRSSFDFNRRQAYVEGSHRFGRFSLAGRYAFGRTRLFNERIAPEDQLAVDRVFNPGVRLSSFSVSAAHDTRDDSLAPTRGSLVLLDGALAAKSFGSQIGFIRTYGQA
ncbi:MAG: hypothetical protein EHM13_03155, partial [Acidobacteria bacterium]